MGDQARFSPEGPRDLKEADRDAGGQPKVVHNPESMLITRPSPSGFEPIIDAERQRQLVALLDQRGATQRGKPRSHDPARNPLGTRVIDMNCTWPMYRTPHEGAFRYLCGLYMQSHGATCAHNHIDGPTAVRFLLSCVRQRVLAPRVLARLEERLRERARQEANGDEATQELRSREASLLALRKRLETLGRNMGWADTREKFQVISADFDEVTGQVKTLEAEINTLRHQARQGCDIDAEVNAALALLEHLPEWAAESEDYVTVGELFRQLNVKLFVRFQAVAVKKRVLNKLVGGVVTFGASPPPVEIYTGPTARQKLTDPATQSAAGSGDLPSPAIPKPCGPGQEGESLGNVSRGDWIRTSDLLNPIQAQTQRNPLSDNGVTTPPTSACTPACTSEPGTAPADPLAPLAAVLLGLSEADRARLAAILLGNRTQGEEPGTAGARKKE